MSWDSDLLKSIPYEEHVRERRSELLLSEKAGQSALDMSELRLDSLIAQTWDVTQDLKIVASVRSMPKPTLLRLLRRQEQLQKEVLSLQHTLLAWIAPSLSSTLVSSELSSESTTLAGHQQLDLNFSKQPR